MDTTTIQEEIDHWTHDSYSVDKAIHHARKQSSPEE